MFRDLVTNLRNHKVNTKSSFTRVRDKHRDYESKFRSQEVRIKELERTIKVLQAIDEVPVKVKKAAKKKRAKKK